MFDKNHLHRITDQLKRSNLTIKDEEARRKAWIIYNNLLNEQNFVTENNNEKYEAGGRLNQTHTPTPTPTVTPTCGTIVTQYLRTRLLGCSNFDLTLFNNPNFTGNANAICDYIVSGVAYGDMGTIFVGTETIAQGDHVHTFNLNSVLQQHECVATFSVTSILPQCNCVSVNIVSNTPTPTPTPTKTPTPSHS